MTEFDFATIEKKWQTRWEEQKVFEAKESSEKPKSYVLEMFAYPSGAGLHMGHAFNYILGDILARFKILKGFNVLHPVGYDALGLPAENAAIKEGTHPEDYTKKSMANFMAQQKMLGLSYDWSRLINTSSQDYYKWDQWIFLEMLKRGLAYQKTASVNWCPSCKTVLANEQAQTGNCERCGTKVEIKNLKQWFLKITDYADELLDKIDDLNWPEKTKAMQKHWIGKSYGTEIDFEIFSPENANNKTARETFPIFTTRPDTIYGVTFMVISAQHPKLFDLVTDKQKSEVEKFLKKLKSVSEKDLADMEKEGVFTGSYAINPITKEKVPIYAGNFVVADYGSGMVMAVPAHDSRDFAFAKKYGIPIKVVIDPIGEEIEAPEKMTSAYTESGNLIDSGKFDGIENEKAKKEITKFLEEKDVGRKKVQFKLRDWLISRQRYWGTPIPIVYCEKCGVVPVDEKDLPVKLPKEVKFGEGNPLETNEKWIKARCPKCGGEARRETDTMDTFVNSSWYFFRFCDPNNVKKTFDEKKVGYWCPIDFYIGGPEHACMHLIYCRFYTKFLRDIGLINFDEPAKTLFHQGMVNDSKGEKMSKSKGNVVEPIGTMQKYGVDVTRYFLVSVASPESGFNWSDEGIQGSAKFLKRVWSFFEKQEFLADNLEVQKKLNDSIKRIENFYDTFDYRKAIIELNELFKIIEKNGASRETQEKFLQLLSPICPHIAEEIWSNFGNGGFIATSCWPEAKAICPHIAEEDLNEKIAKEISSTIERLEGKGEAISKVYLYVLPFEKAKLKAKILGKKLEREVFVYSVEDKEKYDPLKKSRKARPGKPAIYFE